MSVQLLVVLPAPCEVAEEGVGQAGGRLNPLREHLFQVKVEYCLIGDVILYADGPFAIFGG